MKAIDHTISLTGRDTTILTIFEGHELPAHAAYLGVHRGRHEAHVCHCDRCMADYAERDR